MKRVFLYVRVSTEEQALHGLSIEAQTAALHEWAKQNGHKVVDTYIDAGISARKPATKRPELQRLLGDVRAGKGDLIAFTKLDRWFRSLPEYYKVQEELERYHIDWKTIHEDYDTSNASGRLKINIMLSVAQDEADRTSERIKAINDMKRKKLEPLTGDCPAGYKIEGKKYIKDPAKEKAVSGFFSIFLATGSVSKAMEYTNDQCGLRITYRVADRMLRNTAYYGRYFDADGMTPPYITKEQYDKIQSMRRHLARKTKKNRVYIFSGIICCGECGHRMGGRVNTAQETFFYNCTSHYMSASNCKNRANITQSKIEAFIVEHIKEDIEQWKIESLRRFAANSKRDYKNEIDLLQYKLKKLKDLFLNDLITIEEFKADKSTFEQKITELTKEAQSVEMPNFKKADELLQDGWETIYFGMKPEKKLEFWRILLKQIRLYPDRHIEYDLNL